MILDLIHWSKWCEEYHSTNNANFYFILFFIETLLWYISKHVDELFIVNSTEIIITNIVSYLIIKIL